MKSLPLPAPYYFRHLHLLSRALKKKQITTLRKKKENSFHVHRGPTAKNNVGEKKLTKPIEEAAVSPYL